MHILPLQFTHSLISFCCDLRTTAYSRTMPMETLAFMLLLFKWRTSSLHHPLWQWAVYQFSSLFKFKRSPSHLVWLIQPLWEPLLQMDPALLLEALTKNGSLPGVEEMLQRESQHHAWTHWLPYFLLNLINIWLHAQRIDIGRGRRSNRMIETRCRCKIHTFMCAHMLACITLILGEEPWWA